MEITDLVSEWQEKYHKLVDSVISRRDISPLDDLSETTEKLTAYFQHRTCFAAGHVCSVTGDKEGAAYVYETVVRLAENDPVLRAKALRNLADIRRELGQTDEAMTLLDRAAAIVADGPISEIGRIQISKGAVFRQLGQHEQSLQCNIEATRCYHPKEEDYAIAAHNCLVSLISVEMNHPDRNHAAKLAETVLQASKIIRTSHQYSVYSDYLSAIAHMVAGYPKPAARNLAHVRARLVRQGAPFNYLALTYIDEAQAFHRLEYPSDRREALFRAAEHYPPDHPIQAEIAKVAAGNIEPWEIRSLAYAPAKRPTQPTRSGILDRIRPSMPTVLATIMRRMLKKA